MAFIRPYQPSDWDRTALICRQTLPPTLASSPQATTLAPYVWTHQYTTLCPRNCFVLDDGAGSAVGYVIGCPDVFAFVAGYGRYVDEVLRSERGRQDVGEPRQVGSRVKFIRDEDGGGDGVKRGEVDPECLRQLAWSGRWLLLEGGRGKGEMVGEYRGTMHIDLLEEFQGKGWGKRLVERFVESIREVVGESKGELDGGKGVHIGVSGENTKVVKFYEKVGFKVREGGDQEGSVWMMRDI